MKHPTAKLLPVHEPELAARLREGYTVDQPALEEQVFQEIPYSIYRLLPIHIQIN